MVKGHHRSFRSCFSEQSAGLKLWDRALARSTPRFSGIERPGMAKPRASRHLEQQTQWISRQSPGALGANPVDFRATDAVNATPDGVGATWHSAKVTRWATTTERPQG